MHGKAELSVSGTEGPAWRPPDRDDRWPQGAGIVVICCPRSLRKHTISPRGAVFRSDRLSPHSSGEPERMRRTLVASGERK